jgi:hypothetical protein
MIVVGSLGKPDVERFLLGSVSEKVVRNSKVPVLVVREILKFSRYFSRIQREEKFSTDAVSGGRE